MPGETVGYQVQVDFWIADFVLEWLLFLGAIGSVGVLLKVTK